jgi:DNA topoisomerase-3
LKTILDSSFLNEKTKESYNMELINIDRLINDKKVTDHHAIIPTVEAAKPNLELPVNELNVLVLIAYKFLAAAYLPHEYIKTELILDIEKEEFKTIGRQITENGFKEYSTHLTEQIKKQLEKGKQKKNYVEKDDKEEENLPPLIVGEIIPKVKIVVKEKQTSPPKPYTEDTLLSAMENAMKTLEDEQLKKEVAGAGLGTPATRAGIIERIIKTGFIERKVKNLLPTQKAYEMVDIVPEKVKSAILTAEWEQKLEQIYKGELESKDFIKSIECYVDELVSQYKGNYSENGKEIIGKCPRCGKNIYESKTNYYCEKGRECNFVIWKQDNFFVNKRKPLTKPMVKAFLEKGKIKAAGLYSKKKNTTYMAYIIMEDTGQYVNFKLLFPE